MDDVGRVDGVHLSDYGVAGNGRVVPFRKFGQLVGVAGDAHWRRSDGGDYFVSAAREQQLTINSVSSQYFLH